MQKVRILVVLVLIACPGVHLEAENRMNGNLYKSDEWRVQVQPPKGWTVSTFTSYPSILLWITRPDARMFFAAEKVSKDVELHPYAMEVAEKLKSKGYIVRTPTLHSATGAYIIDFHNDKHFLRQALLIPSQMYNSYSLTLSTTSSKSRGRLLRAFDLTLRSIVPNRK